MRIDVEMILMLKTTPMGVVFNIGKLLSRHYLFHRSVVHAH